MEADSKVIPFVPRTVKKIVTNIEILEPQPIEETENLKPLEYSTMTGFQVISAKDFIQSHPDAARAMFNSARDQYNMAIEAMGFLEQAFEEESHTAEIIDARDPEMWKNKTKNKED